MIRDLDPLLRARGIGAVIVPMHEAMHSSFRWLSRGAKVTRGYAIKVADREPFLVTYPMEREEAQATGLEVRLVHEYVDAAPTDPAGYAELFANILGDSGSVAFYGNAPFISTWPSSTPCSGAACACTARTART